MAPHTGAKTLPSSPIIKLKARTKINWDLSFFASLLLTHPRIKPTSRGRLTQIRTVHIAAWDGIVSANPTQFSQVIRLQETSVARAPMDDLEFTFPCGRLLPFPIMFIF